MADFQEYYNLDISCLGKELDYKRAGTLCYMLPKGSRVMRETNAGLAWDDNTYLLSAIEYDFRCLLYSFIDKKNRPAKSPEPYKPMNKAERERRIKGNKSLVIDGEKIEPTTKEMLKEKFGH